jgi:pyruvate dehydrogenase E2 component (dihydrolipoamide acetyltransferase)
VETNKAEVEIPSPYVGRIVALGGAEGETLPVGTLLARIDTGGEQKRAPVLVGYGTDSGMDRSRRPRAAPKVRKLAAELAVDLASLRPSGEDAIVTREDVLAASGARSESIAVQGVRARMATQMSLSRSRIPDAHASVQVDCSALLRLRDRLDVTPFVLTLRMLVIALGRHPVLNATWLETEGGPRIQLHRSVRLGIAVASDRGLVVPVVGDADTLTTRRLATVVDDMVERARAGRLAPAELGGSTFTVSNFGALGLDEGVPVINYPEAAILGIGSLKPRAVVLDDAVVARPTMTLTCAFDHRIADGAQAAAFLTDLRGLIEEPETALLDL